MTSRELDDAAPADRFTVDGVALTLARMTWLLARDGNDLLSAAVLRCTGFSCATTGRKFRQLHLRARNSEDFELLYRSKEDIGRFWQRLSPQWGETYVWIVAPVDELVGFEQHIADALLELPETPVSRFPERWRATLRDATNTELEELGRMIVECSTVVRYRERKDNEDKLALRLLSEVSDPEDHQIGLLRCATSLALEQRGIVGVNMDVELVPEVAELVAPSPDAVERTRPLEWFRGHPLAEASGFTGLPRYLDKLWREVGDDPPAALATAKNLMEATAKWIIDQAETLELPQKNPSFSQLTGSAHLALGLSPDGQPRTDEERIANQFKKVANQTATAIGHARNAWGDGHGRPELAQVGDDFVTFAAHVAAGYARFLIRAAEVRGLASH